MDILVDLVNKKSKLFQKRNVFVVTKVVADAKKWSEAQVITVPETQRNNAEENSK